MAQAGLWQAVTIANQICKEFGSKVLSDEEKEEVEQLKTIARTFIDEVNKTIDNAIIGQTLQDRIKHIGQFMHKNDTNTRKLLVIAHQFQTKLNEFIGRTVNLTYVTKDGQIIIQTDAAAIDIYNKMIVNKSGLMGKTFMGSSIISNNKHKKLNEQLTAFEQDIELKKLQNDIDKAVANRKQVYIIALERFNKEMSYKERTTKKGNKAYDKHSVYWHLAKDDHYIDWWPVPSGGAIGEGYVDMIVNSRTNQSPGPYTRRPYNRSFQLLIQDLAIRASRSDSVAGILQGDVRVGKEGTIQLAVKQSNTFSAASIGPSIGLAYAILSVNNDSILKNIRTIMQTKFQNQNKIRNTTWQSIFIALTNDYIVNGDNQIEVSITV